MGDAGGVRSSWRAIWIATTAAVVSIGAIVLAALFFGGEIVAAFRGSHGALPGPATFVGSESCAGCHRSEAELWRSSQHKHAMDHATEKAVLGEFNNAAFEYYGVRSRFFRKDGKFFVETDGPDGKLAMFEIKYTFGLEPLQQYLVEFPDGRLQALSIAWDSRPKDKGGQRWFHLYPNEEIRHDDVLHWTRLNQNWNFMCAECHSTGVQKNYDAAKDRFATTWAEISVGCEACHGRGSHHVEWARAQQSWWASGKSDDRSKGLVVRFDERRDVSWAHDAAGNPQRSVPPAILRKEVETCGFCHARRGAFSEDWVPGRWLSDTHAVSTIGRGLYHADGQQRDEVYNYGSFKQSRMYAAGVTCSDCHDPHSAKLRLPGNDTCLQCHAADTQQRSRRSVASPATCRCAPTWWSIRGTITASASRGPICRPSSARPTPATIAMPTRRLHGRRPPSSAGTDRTGRDRKPSAMRSTRHGTAKRMPRACLRRWRPTARRRLRGRAPSSSSLRASRPRTSIWRGADLPIPTPWCG
jgi:hypothetical protein